MKVLVTGAQGMLGLDVVLAFQRTGHNTIHSGKGPAGVFLDVTDIAVVRAVLLESKPDIVVHCAAHTAVDRAESEQDEAYRTNALGSWNVATVCEEIGAAVCAISTDYVFDGTKLGPYDEFDTPNPIGVYGRSKLAGEICIRQACPRHWIVRTSWLYGIYGKCFPDTILKAAAEGKPLRVVADQVGSPTHTADLASALPDLIESCLYGTYHLVNRGATSWYEFARETLRLAGHDLDQVQQITTADWPTAAKRPANSVLRPLALEMQGRYKMRSWQEALADYIEKRQASARS